jgi:hypothetical protein
MANLISFLCLRLSNSFETLIDYCACVVLYSLSRREESSQNINYVVNLTQIPFLKNLQHHDEKVTNESIQFFILPIVCLCSIDCASILWRDD